MNFLTKFTGFYFDCCLLGGIIPCLGNSVCCRSVYENFSDCLCTRNILGRCYLLLIFVIETVIFCWTVTFGTLICVLFHTLALFLASHYFQSVPETRPQWSILRRLWFLRRNQWFKQRVMNRIESLRCLLFYVIRKAVWMLLHWPPIRPNGVHSTKLGIVWFGSDWQLNLMPVIQWSSTWMMPTRFWQ